MYIIWICSKWISTLIVCDIFNIKSDKLFHKKLVGEKKNPGATSLTEWTPHFNGFFGVVQTGSTLCSRVKMITVKVVVQPQQVQLGSKGDVSDVHVVESYIRG